jgi:alkylation response protein AidB-like acyl-CoA dehydrogenase
MQRHMLTTDATIVAALATEWASTLKLKATELAVVVAQKCVQYYSARRYLRDMEMHHLR